MGYAGCKPIFLIKNMKQALFFIVVTFTIISFSCCASKPKKNAEDTSSNSYSKSNIDESQKNNYESSTSGTLDDEANEDVQDNSTGCKFEDDTYSAIVNYHNSETGYSTTYTLNVVVRDCQIVQINFPNDGYLDEDHITYADIDEDGNASVFGENGKSYEIQIYD